MEFEKVVDGIVRYIEKEMYAGMNDWQEVLARIAVGRVAGNVPALKNTLMNNPIAKSFAIMDSDGQVNVEQLAEELKLQISKKGKIEIALPAFGKFYFTPADVEKLKMTIMEG